MPLNKVKGNMYNFISHTWNAIKGRCSHNCNYCYMIPFWKNEVHLDEKELKTDLGKGNFIFVGSGTDMFAENVPKEWIEDVLAHCCEYQKNTYLFQTKNPRRFKEFLKWYPKEFILGTTIESERRLSPSVPEPMERAFEMGRLNTRKFVTIEPIIDFNIFTMVDMIKNIKPEFVNIGADSKGHKLPEPSSEKIKELIKELEKFTKVNLKDNLKRLMK